MSRELLTIFAIFMVLFTLQSVGGFFQIKDLQRTLKRLRTKGNIGAGQKRGRFFNGNLVIIACDSEGVITAAESLDGMSFIARFHPVEKVWDIPLVGTHISVFMDVIKEFDKKQRKKHRGYVNAIEALDMRLYPEHYTQEELDAVVAAQMKNKYIRPGKQGSNTGKGKPKSISQAAAYVNPETYDSEE